MKEVKKALFAFISAALSLLMVMQIMPLSVIASAVDVPAEEITTEIAEENISDGEEAVPSDSSGLICEVTDKRDANTKHFLRADGSFEAVVYPDPVHFKKEDDGEWIDINNTLVEQKDENNNSFYAPKESPVKVEFAKNAADNNFVSYTAGGEEISWSYDNTSFGLLKKSSAAEIIGEKELKIKKEDNAESIKMQSVKDVESKLKYGHIYNGVDVEYTVTANGLKENIILKSRMAKTEFDITYNIGGLTAKQADEKTIVLYKGDTAVSEIQAPYMTDSAMQTSGNISLKILSQQDGIMKVKLSADSEWLNDKSREYPVVIDPYINEINRDIEKDATAIYNSIPDGERPYGSLVVGNNPSDYGTCRSLLQYDLPLLSRGDTVIGAQVSLCQFAGDDGYSSSSVSSSRINISRVTGEWESDKINHSSGFSGLPGTESKILDYIYTSAATAGTWVSFNVGKAVRDWYNGKTTNYGFLLWAADENEEACTIFASADFYENNTAYKPTLTVIYLNNKGLEDRWTYHSMSLGESGTAHINDCTGNLVFVSPIYSTGGHNCPVDISLVYNGYSVQQEVSGQGKAGKGWSFDFNQKITPISSGSALYTAGFRYIYTDRDGTEHYFKAKSGSSNQFEDEEGLDYTLSLSTGSTNEYYVLTFKSGAKNTYRKSGGGIYRMYDANGNSALYTYDSNNKITSLKDGGNRYAFFAYDDKGNVISITEQRENNIPPVVTTFSYHSTYNLLTDIHYPDGSTTHFTYNNYRVAGCKSTDGRTIKFTYPSAGDTSAKSRVSAVSLLGTDGTTNGGSLNMDYSYNSYTKFTDNKGRSETFVFDGAGRTVCVNSADGGGYKYSYTDGSSSSLANKLTAAAATTKHINNMLKNHSFESSLTNWKTDGSGGTVSAASDGNAYVGNKSLKINKTSAGNLKAFQAINVDGSHLKENTVYTFSAYVKTTSEQANASIYATCFKKQNGSNVAIKSYSSTSVNEITDGYKRIYFYFTVPEGTSYVNFVLSAQGTGTTYFDAAQVEEGNTVNDYNLLENSAFNDSASSWTKQNLISSDSVVKYNSDNAFKITGSPSLKKLISQDVAINKPASKCAFSVSASAVGNSVPLTASDRFFSINTVLIFTDGTTEYFDMPFNADVSVMQYNTGMVKAKSANSSKTIATVRVRLVYYDNANNVWFDNISLNLDESGTSYTYDSKGNIVSSSDNANTNQKYTYNNAQNLVKSEFSDNTSYTYTYDEGGKNKHRLLTAKSVNSNIQIAYGYNSKGSVNKVTVSGSGTNQVIETSSEYGGTYQNELRSETDALGNKTSYTYISDRCLLKTSTDSAGNVTTYDYNDTNDLLTSVSSGGSEVIYWYDSKDLLNKIETQSSVYTFDYDNFLNPSKVSVGFRTLSSNTYEANNGNLLKSTYGNGSSVNYTYDNFDRVTQKAYNNSNGNQVVRYNWAYNAKGQIARAYDSAENLVYNYTYDLSGRPIEMYRGDGAYIRTKYDSNNLTTGTEYKFGGVTEKTTYEYQADKDNAPYKASFTNGNSAIITYDALGRVQNTAVQKLPGQFLFMATYSYLNNPSDSNKTSGVVSKIDYTNNLGSFSYKYDSRGNITEETLSDVTVNSYQYDSLNRLTRVDSEAEGNTHIYTYDGSGNILSDKVYTCYLNSEPLANKTLIKTINYTYGDSDWGDKLTAYNGKAITYDDIGNPLTYDGQSFTWLGRRMMSYTGGGVTTNYKYNSDGIRTTKTTGTTATTFFLNGSTILAQKTGNTVIPFYYNAAGDRVGFKYNGEMYFYVKNLQGDVVKIVNSSKAVVGEYKYDAWGKILNLDSLTDIAKANPFRYRGYYYDTESNLYYLNSRYYNPEWGRFINADSIVASVGGDVNGYNLFVYCFNNPIVVQDQSGLWGKIFSQGASVLKKAINHMTPKERHGNYIPMDYTKQGIVIKNDITVDYPLIDGGPLFGKISVSRTTLMQLEDSAPFYSFIDVGTTDKWGAGINTCNMLVLEIFFSEELDFTVGLQVTPWVHADVSIGLTGIGISGGFIFDDKVSGDLNIKIGWGSIAGYALLKTVRFPVPVPAPAFNRQPA